MPRRFIVISDVREIPRVLARGPWGEGPLPERPGRMS